MGLMYLQAQECQGLQGSHEKLISSSETPEGTKPDNT